MATSSKAEKAQKWLEDMANDVSRVPISSETLALRGIHVLTSQSDRVLCNFTVPKFLADKDGNWVAGAIATLIDDVGAMAIAAATGLVKVSVEFDISYFSPAKFNEEVEIEATPLAHMGKVSSVIVEVRKKESGELVAVGKQWMASVSRLRSKL